MTTSRTATASASKALSVSKGPRLTKVALALSTALTPVWAVADSLPTGGTVVHGSAAIGAPTAGALTIDQSSNRAVVNWDSFSIGTQNRVTINQPSADAAILNRVTGDTTSQIHGQLNANGRVFVVNPNGIFIGPTGTVNAGSFVASTLGIRTDDFAMGNTVFEGDGSSATVVNEGNVQVVTGGYAALIGGQVKNSGTIQAPLGFVGLGSGERITLDLGGDGFLQVAVPTNTDDPALQALIENSGSIQANGGTVQMSAATARNAARHAINMSGVVEARTVSGRNGRITLGGGGGKVSVSGTMTTHARRPAIQVTQSARPTARPARGGDITITGGEITLAGATLDASGTDGGGNIRVGGNQQGAPGLPTADTLAVDATTNITADAVTSGNGGRVILWSEIHTAYQGNISVRGGSDSGDGGFVEVSGKETLSYAGFVDAGAANGASGTLLLDPSDIEVVAAAPGLNQILNTDLESALAGADVVVDTDGTGDLPLGFVDLSEAGDIQINAPISWTSANTLRFNADQDITVNSAITVGSLGGLVLDGSRDVIVDADIDADNADLTIFAGTNLNVNPGVTLDGMLGTITLDSLGSISMDGTINADGSNMFFDGDIVGIGGAINANASLIVNSDDIVISGAITGNNSTFDFDSAGDLTMTASGSITGQDTIVTLVAANAMSLNGTFDLPNVTFDNATLSVDNFGSGPISVGTSSSVDVGLFHLLTGDWVENNATLGLFDADNFVLESGSSFLRVTGGDGSTIPYTLTDVYGLQGAPTVFTAGIGFELGNDIDATPATSWRGLVADGFGRTNEGFVPLNMNSNLDGNGNTISNLFIRRFESVADGTDAGLFSTISGSTISDLFITGADVAGDNVGILTAFASSATLTGISTSGSVSVYGSTGGGIAAASSAVLDSSRSDATVAEVADPSDPTAEPAAVLGGLVGENGGVITNSKAEGSVTGNRAGTVSVGGIVGNNSSDGSILDSYSTATVVGDSTPATVTTANVGGIAGNSSGGGSSSNVLASGPLTLTGPGSVGGITGLDSPGANISGAFFDTVVTGQTASGAVGEAPTDAQGVTTAFLRDVEAFTLAALAEGWSFTGDWAFPLDGVDHARLYTVDPAISATDPTEMIEFTYNATTDDHTAPGAVYFGGPTDFVFGPVGDAGDLTVLDDGIVLSSADVGSVTFRFPTSFTSDLGQVYSVRSRNIDAEVVEAPLTILVNDSTKVYGEELTFAGVSFSTDTLFGTDSITSATVVSAGAPATATVAGSPYPLSLEAFVGTGLSNYDITVTPGDLTVTRRPLTVSVTNQTKLYGETFTFAGTEFAVSGLVNSDTLTSLSLSSAGAEAGASVAGSPYAINGGSPVGTGLDNYTVNIIPGSMVVTPRTATVSVDSRSKVYGETISLDGDFTVTGLVLGDAITSLTLTSEGTAATAPVSGSPYAITASDPSGPGAENYTLTVTAGTITVTPAPLTITADDQEKPFGTEFTFAGTEFSVTGLLNSDTVSSATLSSIAAAADADLTGEGGAAILISDASGSGLDNYDITFVNGIFVVAPGDLIITPTDLSKTYGEELVFAGTEFTVTGLAPGDSVDSVTLVSDGAVSTAGVIDSPYTILASNAVGSGLEKYELVFADGSLTVVPAPLTITALDQTKQQGQAFTFAGTEFSVSGLLNSDTIDSVVLSSAGADVEALAEDGPFAITVGDATGTGVENYAINGIDGLFTVQNQVDPPTVDPTPPFTGGTGSLPNPRDTIRVTFPSLTTGPGAEGGETQTNTGGGTSQQTRNPTLAVAQRGEAAVDTISEDVELAIQSCGSADQDFSNYMACLSESLDTYANALDEIANDLPPEFEQVSAVIRQARDGVNAANARAQRRLLGATSDAERRAIQRDAINEARGAINEAKEEIRKAITLIRADDPEVAAVQRQTGSRIIQAFDTIDTELVRAVEL